MTGWGSSSCRCASVSCLNGREDNMNVPGTERGGLRWRLRAHAPRNLGMSLSFLLSLGKAFFICFCKKRSRLNSSHFGINTSNVRAAYVYFLELPEGSVNHNLVMVRPQHGGHVHLQGRERSFKSAKTFPPSLSPPSLTLLFSLCITPITRTLMG